MAPDRHETWRCNVCEAAFETEEELEKHVKQLGWCAKIVPETAESHQNGANHEIDAENK